MDTELKTIVATLREKDVDVLFGDGVEDFFRTYGELWHHTKDYYSKFGVIPDLSVMAEKFPPLQTVDAQGHPEYYMEQLRSEFLNESIDRILLKGAQFNKSGASGQEALEKIQEQLAKFNRYSSVSQATNIMDLDAAEERYEELRARVAAMGGTPGIPTGVDFFDSAYPAGLQGGDLVVVLGWTGRAKSFFTTLVAANAYTRSYVPMIASLEMDADKIQDRVFTTMGKGLFRNSDLVLGDFRTDSFDQFRQNFGTDVKFWIVESDGRSELTPNSMQVKHNQHRPDIHIWDYAQLMSDNERSENTTVKMMNLSNQAKAFAKANDVPVVLISSATPEGKVDDIPPTIEQVAWSKQLAYNADLAIAVHKHTDSDLIDIVCRKNRNGPLFAGTLNWDINTGEIKEVPL